MKGVANTVRHYASTVGRFRVAEAARHLGLKREQVNDAVGDLAKRGELERVDRGVYQYVDVKGRARNSPKMDAVWRAMRLSATWTISEIARQAGVTNNYARKLTLQWQRQRYLEAVGHKRLTAAPGSERVYRMINRAKLDPPKPAPGDEQDGFKHTAWQALGRILLGKTDKPEEREKCKKELQHLMEKLDERQEEE